MGVHPRYAILADEPVASPWKCRLRRTHAVIGRAAAAGVVATFVHSLISVEARYCRTVSRVSTTASTARIATFENLMRTAIAHAEPIKARKPYPRRGVASSSSSP
jgi:hypothetical protein